MRRILLTTSAFLAGILLAGCGSANDGGATPCGAFVKMSESERIEVIKTWKPGLPEGGYATVAEDRYSACAFRGLPGQTLLKDARD